MFERYTEKARRAIFFARYEASQFGSPEIESEQILLGLLREGKTGCNSILGLPDYEVVRAQIEAAVDRRQKVSTSVNLKLSNESKRILAYGAEEAERLKNKHIGIEHLLLGILREKACLAAKILQKQGLKLEEARKCIVEAKDQLGAFAPRSAPVPAEQPTAEEVPDTRRPVSLRVVITCGSELLLAYRSHFGPPRIGESILIRDADGASQTYRVQDIVWGLSLNEAIVLKEVNVRVTQENAS